MMDKTITEGKTIKNKKRFKFSKRDLIFVIIGVLFAITLRFIFIPSNTVHHHANFALYVDGQRDLFENFTFYEEIAACSSEDHSNPKSRVHMHNQENSMVHVHDGGVTWGHFFANLGYTLGNSVLVTDDGNYIDGENGKSLKFILDGTEVSSIANAVIASDDRLLISYGDEDLTTLLGRYNSIPDNADEYNQKPDPSSCSGGGNESLKDRFTRTLGIDSLQDNKH